MRFSIIICTFNRGYLIRHCLDALVALDYPKSNFEVLLVDNNSNDGTNLILKEYVAANLNFKYVFVERKGLSIARNEGVHSSKGDYIIYIDDDAIASKNYLRRLNEVIEKKNFEVIGGVGYPWYFFGKPRWMPNNFGYNNRGLEDIGILREGFIDGFSMCFKKEILMQSSMFPENLGMSGDKVAYGEETALINELRKKKIEIAFDPQLSVKHLVAKHKLKVLWHIKAYYAHGRDNKVIWGNKTKDKNYLSLFKLTTFKFITALKRSLPKFLNQKDYYIQNLIIDVGQPIAYLWGSYK